MARVRRPAVAGLFYPQDPAELERTVRGHLEPALAALPQAESPPAALIAPHAGYVYSGPVAASAYARIARLRDVVSRVVLLGPAHRVALRGMGASDCDAFETPLGEVPVDRRASERALELRSVAPCDRAHEPEHSLEVQLPFLQVVLGEFELVPLVVGDAEAADVRAVVERLWGGPETLVVISSDLSHYLDYETARRTDRLTTRAIEELRPDDIAFEHACGRLPVQGLLLEAQRRGLSARAVDVRNSGDTAGPRDSVVGYGAYVVA